MEEKKNVCVVCGTTLIKSDKPIKTDGSLKLDGTWNLNNMICPKCHPEYVSTK